MTNKRSIPAVDMLLFHVKHAGNGQMVALDKLVAKAIVGSDTGSPIEALIATIEDAVERDYLTRWSTNDPFGEGEPVKLHAEKHENAMVGVRLTIKGENQLVHRKDWNVV